MIIKFIRYLVKPNVRVNEIERVRAWERYIYIYIYIIIVVIAWQPKSGVDPRVWNVGPGVRNSNSHFLSTRRGSGARQVPDGS